MKGLVTEEKNGMCAVLKRDGTFIRIKGSYRVGTEIELDSVKADNVVQYSGRKWKTFAAAAAAALAVVVGVGGSRAYRENTVSSYVTIDVKPSIEYSLNADNRVLKAVALSSDAQDITDELNRRNIKGETLPNAVKKTIEVMKDKGYIEDGSEEILISVTSKDEKTASALKETAESAARENITDGASVIAVTASEEERETASKEGKSAARLELEKGTLKTDEGSADKTSGETGEGDAAKPAVAAPSSAETSDGKKTDATGKDNKTSAEKSEPVGFTGGATAITNPDAPAGNADASGNGTASGNGDVTPQDPSGTGEGKEPAGGDVSGTGNAGGNTELPPVLPPIDDPEPSEGGNENEDGGFTGSPIAVH